VLQEVQREVQDQQGVLQAVRPLLKTINQRVVLQEVQRAQQSKNRQQLVRLLPRMINQKVVLQAVLRAQLLKNQNQSLKNQNLSKNQLKRSQ